LSVASQRRSRQASSEQASPFGGYKQSGYGREMGNHALDLYTQIKSVWVDLSGKPIGWFGE
jgi:acyl-CoA reductase-like NAD-dependent aldehyde dehydrogenase